MSLVAIPEEVNPVQKWLEDVRMMTECECMCILQGKSLLADNTSLTPIQTAKDGIHSVKEHANNISGEFSKLFRRIEKEKWKHLRHSTLQITCQIRSLIHQSTREITDPPPYIMEQEELVMGECAKLAQQAESFSLSNHSNSTDGVPQKIPLVNQLTYLGQSFSRLVDLLLGHLIQSIVQVLDSANTPQTLNTSISSLISLGLEGEHMCYIIAREGGVRALFDVCRTPSIQFCQAQALRALATICCVSESIMELERVGGLECLTDILCESRAREDLLGEAAGVVAQITSPCLDHYQHIAGFIENMEDLIRALTVLCQMSSKHEVFLLSAAAIANITFMDSMACDFLLQSDAVHILIQACAKNKASSMFAKDQVATVLANMAVVETCRGDIVENNGIELLLSFLRETPSTHLSEAEKSACERVQQKAAIALTRLCRETDSAQKIVHHQGIPRLVQLCRDVPERNNSDAVLVACLAALRKICSVCGTPDMSLIDIQQLVKPRLMDSFLMCTHRDENFV